MKIKSIKITPVIQPIGEFYIASIDAKTALEISFVDRMRVKDKSDEISVYTGIQRPLDKRRITQISAYVKTVDASFPTAIIMSVTEDCADISQDKTELQLTEVSKATVDSLVEDGFIDNNQYIETKKDSFTTRGIAKILDGQHRLAGLEAAIKDTQTKLETKNLSDSDQKELEHELRNLEGFELNVAIFVGKDIHSQAMLFSRVNLAQTKVNPSLVYNLETYTKQVTPQRIAHNITKLFDEEVNSPFYNRIKMLGHKTEDRQTKEFLSQATFVEALMLLMSKDPEKERDIAKRGLFGSTSKITYTEEDYKKYIFNKFMWDNENGKIFDILFNYFTAISEKWKRAWNNEKYLLSKNNCFRAFMLYLREPYNELSNDGRRIPTKDQFLKHFEKLEIRAEDFNSDVFPHGDTGMTRFYKYLIGRISYDELMSKKN